jgi:NADH-quinone oxidoreductase subunit F
VSETPLTAQAREDRAPHTLAEWRALGGYDAVETALRRHTPAEIVEMVTDANLRGRGGAGFPAGKKWSFMPKPGEAAGNGPSIFCVNCDEMEPCTFKDRFLLESLPHRVLEGTIIAAYACGASEAILFIRDAYRPGEAAMRRAIAEAEEAGFLGRNILGTGFDLSVSIHMSAGRYICGEESALLDALEGKRGVPRERPPYPAQSGAWGRPTTVNNCETVAHVPLVVSGGPEWFRGLSRTDDGGTKLYGISGRVARPILVEAAMGTTAGELIERAGGVIEGRGLLAFQPGGGSSGFLGPEHLDVPLDFDHTAEAGSWLGTGMLVVLDEATCPIGVLTRYETFFARESCGWCTPCRDGLPWTVRLLSALQECRGRPEQVELLRMHCDRAPGSFCDLMPGAMDPLRTGLERFADHVDAHLAGRCPVAA